MLVKTMLVKTVSQKRAWLGCMTLIIGLGTAACGGDGEGRPDNELGNLVLAPSVETLEVDPSLASSDVDELLKALALPHGWTTEILGAHQVKGTTSVKVLESGEVLEELSDELALRIDSEGRFQMTLDNSREYGRHASFDGEKLYLRPRFGPYHARPAQSESEAVDIRNEVFAGASAYFELLEGQVEVSDKGEKVFAGRAAREISLQLAPEARAQKTQKQSHKEWRNTIVVESLRGNVSLDAETGAVLQLKFEGSISFKRDGRSLQMKLQAERSISDVGHKDEITAPSDAPLMNIEARHRELAEREQLLKSIAPPARKAPTPRASLNAGRDTEDSPVENGN